MVSKHCMESHGASMENGIVTKSRKSLAKKEKIQNEEAQDKVANKKNVPSKKVQMFCKLTECP